jgi:UDPglucose 6-dehydrogenase
MCNASLVLFTMRLPDPAVAFKADTDDVRSSPAVRLAARVLDEGRPAGPRSGRRRERPTGLPDLVVVSTVEAALQGADAAVIATEWPVYRDLDWGALRKTMRRPLFINGRRLLQEAGLRTLGYAVERVGDGVRSSATEREAR